MADLNKKQSTLHHYLHFLIADTPEHTITIMSVLLPLLRSTHDRVRVVASKVNDIRPTTTNSVDLLPSPFHYLPCRTREDLYKLEDALAELPASSTSDGDGDSEIVKSTVSKSKKNAVLTLTNVKTLIHVNTNDFYILLIPGGIFVQCVVVEERKWHE